ncbi:MAG: hypothetical protein AB7P22_15550 [Vicinamibacterales bacterium]
MPDDATLLDLERKFLTDLARTRPLEMDHRVVAIDAEQVEIVSSIRFPSLEDGNRTRAHGLISTEFRSRELAQSELTVIADSHTIFPLWITTPREYVVSVKSPSVGVRVKRWADGAPNDDATLSLVLLLVPHGEVRSGHLSCSITRRIGGRRHSYGSNSESRLTRALRKMVVQVGVPDTYSIDPGFSYRSSLAIQAPEDTSVRCELALPFEFANAVCTYRVSEVEPNGASTFALFEIEAVDARAPSPDTAVSDVTVVTGPHISGPRLTTEYIIPVMPLAIMLSALVASGMSSAAKPTTFLFLAGTILLGGILFPRPMSLWRDSVGPTALAFSDIERHSHLVYGINFVAAGLGAAMLTADGGGGLQISLVVACVISLAAAFVVGLFYKYRSFEIRRQFLPHSGTTRATT